MKKKLLISTGGSGGHVVPATILYEQLKNEFEVFISTDKRGISFLNSEKYEIKIIDVPKITKNIFKLPYILTFLFIAVIKNFIFFKKNNIEIVLSTGGYMSLPTCLVAKILNLKIYLFEPNMVIGRFNKFFLKSCKKIFCYSDEILNFPKEFSYKMTLINPLIRKEFYSLKKNNENVELKDEIKLLVIGGSQGARLFDDELKTALIDVRKNYNLNVFQQSNILNFKNLKKFYKENNIKYKLFTFEENILKIIVDTDLCITRGGASTLAELTFLNIPCLVIPYPHAKDNHQYHNAMFYKNKDCCWILNQKDLKNNVLSNSLIKILDNKEEYIKKKTNMKKFSYQNSWNKINQKIVTIINEN